MAADGVNHSGWPIGVILARLNLGEVGDQGPFAAVEVV